jgi:hypothetical protein
VEPLRYVSNLNIPILSLVDVDRFTNLNLSPCGAVVQDERGPQGIPSRDPRLN